MPNIISPSAPTFMTKKIITSVSNPNVPIIMVAYERAATHARRRDMGGTCEKIYGALYFGCV